MPFAELLFALAAMQDHFYVFLSPRVWKSDSLRNRSVRYCGARSLL